MYASSVLESYMDKLDNSVTIPDRYVEVDKIEDGRVVFVLIEPDHTQNLKVLPWVNAIEKIKLQVSELSSDVKESERFELADESDAQILIERDDGSKIGLIRSSELTNKISRLLETIE